MTTQSAAPPLNHSAVATRAMAAAETLDRHGQYGDHAATLRDCALVIDQQRDRITAAESTITAMVTTAETHRRSVAKAAARASEPEVGPAAVEGPTHEGASAIWMGGRGRNGQSEGGETR